MQRVLGDDQATDDIAILTATVHALPERARGEMRGWKFASRDGRTAVLVRHETGALVNAAWTRNEEQRFPGELAFGEIYLQRRPARAGPRSRLHSARPRSTSN